MLLPVKVILYCAVLLAELTPVSSVSVEYTCTTHSVMVYWSVVFGADSYKATAIGENGTQLMCTSQSTSCEITTLSCGQNYVVHVTPMSEGCKNMVNTTSATFQTGETQYHCLVKNNTKHFIKGLNKKQGSLN